MQKYVCKFRVLSQYLSSCGSEWMPTVFACLLYALNISFIFIQVHVAVVSSLNKVFLKKPHGGNLSISSLKGKGKAAI